jgi:hypothetical protein
MPKIQGGLELFQIGEKVPKAGQYVLVDGNGVKQNFTVYLAEGDSFPKSKEGKFYYMLEN